MPFGSGLGESELSAIEIAIRATGAAGVRDLENNVASLKQQIAALEAAIRSQTSATGAQLPATAAQIQSLTDLSAGLTRATSVANAARTAYSGLPAGFSLSGQAALQLSYAIDDLQYGFSAIVNNVPQFALAMGAGPGVAGAIGVAVVAANILGKEVLPLVSGSIKELGKSLDLVRDPLRDATDSIEGLKEKKESLQDRPFKLDADYDALRTYTIEVRAAERATREFEALRNKRSESQQAAFEAVQGGIAEGGGAEALQKAILEIAKRNGTYGAGSEVNGRLAQQQAVLDYYRDPANAGIANVGGLGAIRIKQAEAEMAKLREDLKVEQEQKARELMNLTGGEPSRKTLLDLVNDPGNADIFQRNQVDVDRLGGGIGAAAPDVIQGRQRAKVAQAEQQRAAREQKALDDRDEMQRRAAERNAKDRQDADAKSQAEVDRAVEEAGQLSDKIGWEQRRKAEAAGKQGEAAANRAATQRAQAEREAPRLQQQRDVRDLGREAAGRAAGMGLGQMNPAQAEHAGKRAVALIQAGSDPNTALMAVIMEMAQAVEGAHAKAQAQAMGLMGVGQRMRGLNQNQRRGQQRGPTLGVTF